MDKQCKCCGRILLLMLLQLVWLQPLLANTNDTKPVWQQTDASVSNYLSNRRALVGSGCMVNRLGADGVKVVPVITNLENLCDEDLTNVTTVAAVVDATVAVGPLVSVKDVKNYYEAGTQAGFIVAGDASGVLSLSAANLFSIMFYCDGELVGTEAVSEGQSVNGVGLSLIQISDSEASKEYVATAPAKFDEIRLAQTGVIDATVGKTVGIKYAFVGSAKEYTITQASMAEYNSDLTVQSRSTSTKYNTTLAAVTTDWHTSGNLDDDNLENRTTIEALIADAAANVRAYASDGSDAFPAGTTVGFKYHTSTALNLKVGDVAHINLYNKAGDKVLDQTLSASVLTLKLVSGNDNSISVTSTEPFSRVEFYMAGVGLNLGGASAYYAYIQLPPEVKKHHCDLNPTADLNVCDCDNQYQLTASKDVAWSVKSQPDEANNPVSISQSGLVTGLVTPGKYVFTATASSAYCTGSTLCTEDVTINYGASDDITSTSTSSVIRLVNNGDTDEYEVSADNTAGITILGGINNQDALITPSLRDYAYTTAGLSLASKTNIVNVKKKSGTLSYSTTKYVGFVVTSKTTVANADLLNFFTIDLYNGSTNVGSGVVTKNASLLSADLAGSDDVQQKVSYSIEVPAGTEFDRVVLSTAGVLNVSLSKLNVYYAFVSDDSSNPENTGTIVSYNNTGASIDAANTKFVSVANVANTTFGLTNLVDDDLTTCATFPSISVASDAQVAIKIGKTVNSAKQNLLILTNNKSAVLKANLIDVMRVTLYKNGVQVATNESSGTGFDLLNANVLGYNNTYSYIKVSSSVDFDEVILTRGEGLNAADDYEVFGLLLRNDYNGDGVPDESDPEPCAQELVLDEDSTLSKSHSYEKSRMIFHRNLNGDCWNPLILPVNLTEAQFKEAFGDDAVLSAAKEVTVDSETSDGTTTTTSTLVFEKVSSETDGVFMTKNTPYIIYVTKNELENHSSDARYESIEDGEVVGPMFIVDNGISYDKSDDYQTTHSAKSSENATSGQTFTFTGSYNAAQEVSIGNYVFALGDLYHLTKQARTLKAYRCWIEYTPSSSSDEAAQLKGFTVSDGTTTDIHTVVEENAPVTNGILYNLMGKPVNTRSLTPGIYILNGKKVIVK